jgi:hypothetical protein
MLFKVGELKKLTLNELNAINDGIMIDLFIS